LIETQTLILINKVKNRNQWCIN